MSNQFLVEYSRSSRAGCKGCREKIKKEVVRIGKTYEHATYGTSTLWYHLKCFKIPRGDALNSVDEIAGYTNLRIEDRRSIRAILSTAMKEVDTNKGGTKRRSSVSVYKRKSTMSGMTATPSSKRTCHLPVNWKDSTVVLLKSWLEERSLSTSGNKADLITRLRDWQEVMNGYDKRKAAVEKQKYMCLLQVFGSCTVNKMKCLLRLNKQKLSGVKKILIERCADAKLYGCLPMCGECGGGKLNVTYPYPFGHGGQGRWDCKGYHDDTEYVHCHYQTTSPQHRPPWKKF
eukprot:UN33361